MLMRESLTKTRSWLIAATLREAWRATPPPLEISASQLAAVAPLLSASGAAALAWRRVRQSALRAHPSAEALRDAYRWQVVRAGLQELDLRELFSLLREAGAQALLAKGWAASRLYPERGMRPYGDIDIYVRPEEYARAQAALSSAAGKRLLIDMKHDEFARLDERGWDELYARAEAVSFAGVTGWIMGAEDHLRLLCFHLLRHGAWRPLWLCDVAAALESRRESFAWDHLLGQSRRAANWIACALGLAHNLLGARIADTPVAKAAKRIPRWFVRAVLRHWENPFIGDHEAQPLMRTYFRQPAGTLAALRRRWPDPIRATVYCNRSFSEFPRLPWQCGKFLSQSARFLIRLPGELRAQH